MIDKEAFKQAWRKLLVRFNREVDADQAAMYFDYLNDLMDTEEFLTAARAVWAGSTFFPRPADFVTVHAATEWPLVLKAAEEYRPPDASWYDTWKRLSPRAQGAVKRLGGIDAVKDQLGRNSLKIKEAFLTSFEEEATAEVLALPTPGSPKPMLPAA